MQEKELSAKSSQTLETKGRILKAALKLFNENGSDSVTTHQIADEAGLSSGNLYYHYKNKNAIIRALFYEIDIFSVNKWKEKSPSHREVRFSDFMQFYFGSLSKYRFFFHELSSILKNDSVLAEEWRFAYDRLFAVMKDSLQGWIKQGLIRPLRTSEDEDIFIETIWIIAGFTQVHYEARNGRTKKASTQSLRYLARFLYPYHTAKGQRTIDLYL